MTVVRNEAPQTVNVRDFLGMNTQAARIAIDDREFSWLENVLPIGPGNLQVLPAIGPVIATLVETCAALYWANIGGTSYCFAFCQTGSCYQINTALGTIVTVGAAGTFSASGWQIAQWKNERILIVDIQKGLFSWDTSNLVGNKQAVVLDFSIAGSLGGSGYTVGDILALPGGAGAGATGKVLTVDSTGAVLTASINAPGSGYTADYLSTVTGGTGTGAKLSVHIMLPPASGTSIAVYSGRAWMVTAGRTITFSAPNAFWDFTTTDLGGAFSFFDPVVASNIQTLLAANNFLYVFGESSVNAISDVRTSGSPAVTVFSNTNLTSSIGSTFPNSINSFFRSLLFATSYGFYSMYGSTPSKISDQLNGLIPFIDYTSPVTNGVAVVSNIQVPFWLISYKDPCASLQKRPLLIGYNSGKWFLASQPSGTNNLTLITGAEVKGVSTIFGTDGTNIYQLFADTTGAKVTYTLQTKMYDFGSRMRDVRSTKFGIEGSNYSTSNGDPIKVTIDTEIASQPYTFTPKTFALWTNNSSSGNIAGALCNVGKAGTLPPYLLPAGAGCGGWVSSTLSSHNMSAGPVNNKPSTNLRAGSALVFNNQLFIIGGQDDNGAAHGEVYYTSDGVTWNFYWGPWNLFNSKNTEDPVIGQLSACVNPNTNTIFAIWSANFLTPTTMIWSSTDGLNWTLLYSGCAIGGPITLYQTTNLGTTWVTITIPSKGFGATYIFPGGDNNHFPRTEFGFIGFGGNIFMLGGTNPAGGDLQDGYYSPNGLTWNHIVSPIWGTHGKRGSAWWTDGSFLYMYGGFDATREVWKSADGITWTLLGTGPNFGDGVRGAVGVYWGGKHWLISNNFLGSVTPEVSWSLDAITWSACSITDSSFNLSGAGGVFYAQGAVFNNNIWIVGGSSVAPVTGPPLVWQTNITTIPFGTVSWSNNASSNVQWLGGVNFGLLAKGDVSNNGKYIGATISGKTVPFALNGIAWEFIRGASW